MSARRVEEVRMKPILRQALITPRNYSRIAARVIPQDQREAIRPGIRISHYAFTNQRGQSGYVIISHTTGRAGICFAEGQTEWGKWNEETSIITTDSGQRYTPTGVEVFDAADQRRGQEEAPQMGQQP
jgi:hypothetical protein